MGDQLIRYVDDNRPVPRRDRVVANRAKDVYDDTRFAGLQADAAIALGAHIMDGLLALDRRRRSRAQDDPTLNLLLTEIEATTVQQVKEIQRRCFDPWGI